MTIPDGVTGIGNYTFDGCTGLTSVMIGDGVAWIGSNAFENCNSLTLVISFLGVAPPSAGSVFRNIATSACLYVPESAIERYRSANDWKVFSCIKSMQLIRTITFDSQSGSVISSQPIELFDNVTKPTDPPRSNYVFGGWYKEATCITPWDFNTDVVESDITLYAKWIPVTYTVIFVDYNGAPTILLFFYCFSIVPYLIFILLILKYQTNPYQKRGR